MNKPAIRCQRILDEVKGLKSVFNFHSRDEEFVRSIIERDQRHLSMAQERWLKDIEAKVFSEESEDE